MAAEMTEAAAAPVPAGRNKISSILLPVVIFAVLVIVPLAAVFGAEKYVLALVTRVMIFAVAAIAKAGASFLAWRAVAGRKLYSNKSILCYLVFWTAATAVPVSFVLLFWESPLWLKNSFLLLALLSVPLAGPPLATLAMANNRSQR